ncbi:hypothetical protein O181_055457 [Austropuccinia psidii MF-1]|uniref:Uncharacterized protein n=1 Tax=Austropuccinia psidii MF-1 TaxID=1389203 RepID=A0A9Q3HTH2_9BASI|nr:hypothetical protein [Austropuccinia psidii MF-1]
MHVSEGPGSTQEISSKANPQSKFPHEFFLNPVEYQEPFRKSKKPSLNISSVSHVHEGYEKWVDGGKRKLPLENVTQSGLLGGNPGFTLQHKPFHNLICLFHWFDMEPIGKTVQSLEQIEACEYDQSLLIF